MTNKETLNALKRFYNCITADNFACWKKQHDCESCPFHVPYDEEALMVEKSIQIIQQVIDKEDNDDKEETI